MSYPQPPYRPGLQRQESNGVPFPPSAPAPTWVHPQQQAQQPRVPYHAPQSPSGSRHHPASPGPGSPIHQNYRSSTTSSTRSNSLRPGPSPASPSRPDYNRASSSSRPDYNRASSSSRGPPLSPAHSHARVTSHDATSPLKQANRQSDFQNVDLHPSDHAHSAPWLPPNRTPTLPTITIDPEPSHHADAPRTHSRFSADDHFVAAADLGTWPRLAQWTLLPLILVLSAAVTLVLGHSLSLYGGLKIAGTIDYAVATHPIWPADLSLLPAWMLVAVGFTSFCCTTLVWGYSLRVRFMKPVPGLTNFRFGAGVVFVLAWIASLVVYKLMEGRGEGSLESYACAHKADDVVGVAEISRVCTEQNAGFGLAITTVILELGLIGCYAMRKKNGADGDGMNEKQLDKSQA